jgi:hypothetical protein
MKVKKLFIVLSFLVILIGCDKELHEPTRSFYMGFTPFPYAISQEAVDFSYQKITEDSDIVDHHFDNGIPWLEALQNQPFHSNILNDWAYRKSKTPEGHKIYVSIAALSVDRNGLAKYRGENDDMALPSPWDTYQFNDQNVKAAYLNYCKRIIDFFTPDFFNMSVEANLLYYLKPELWSGYLTFHEYIYTELKKAYPNIVIFSSVTGAHMLEGFFAGNDAIQQRLAVLQILEHSDLYALSFYPYLSNYLGNPIPDNTFDELFGISNKPLAVAETGYAAENFMININGSEVSISSDLQKQNKYMTDLLAACEKHKAKFVINFVSRDYDALWQSIGGKNDLSIAWRDTGLYDENGNARLAHTTWRKYLGHKIAL